MGKPIPEVIVVAVLNYSRQFPETKQQTVHLLKELERELGLDDLAEMRETDKILHRIHKSTPERMYAPDYKFYNVY